MLGRVDDYVCKLTMRCRLNCMLTRIASLLGVINYYPPPFIRPSHHQFAQVMPTCRQWSILLRWMYTGQPTYLPFQLRQDKPRQAGDEPMMFSFMTLSPQFPRTCFHHLSTWGAVSPVQLNHHLIVINRFPDFGQAIERMNEWMEELTIDGNWTNTVEHEHVLKLKRDTSRMKVQIPVFCKSAVVNEDKT